MAPLGVAIAAAALVALLLFDGDGEDPAATTRAVTKTVPSVVGMGVSEGFLLLQSSGYQAQVEEEPSVRPAQEIVRQEPEAGSELERGRVVFVTISSGRPPAPRRETRNARLPDVVGRMQVEAGAELERLGFPTDSYPVPSDEAPGTVVGQDPDPGVRLTLGEPVRLTVSRGRGRQPEVTVPHVRGASARDARARTRAEGLTVRTVEREAATRQDVGKVMLEDPAAGTAVAGYTQTSLFVGR